MYNVVVVGLLGLEPVAAVVVAIAADFVVVGFAVVDFVFVFVNG